MNSQTPTTVSPSIIKRDANMSPAYFASASVVLAGNATSSSPGTPVQLIAAGPTTPCHHVALYAYVANASYVFVGDATNTLAKTDKTGKGECLIQGASTICYVVDASLIYFDVVTSGDGVSFTIYS